MKRSAFNTITSCIVMVLIAGSAVCLGWLKFTQKTNVVVDTILMLLYGTIILLTIQIALLLRRQIKSGGTLIFADLDKNGIPEIIYEVPETTAVQFCKKEFKMVYKIEYWPSLRSRLLAERDSDSPSGLIAGRLYQQGCSIASGDFVAYLEYMAQSRKRISLLKLAQMPTPADGAIEVIRNSFSAVRVFHNPQELAGWEYEIADAKKTQFRILLNRYLKRRAIEVG